MLKPGIRSSEFWGNLVGKAFTAVVGVVVVEGLLSEEAGSIIQQSGVALIGLAVPALITYLSHKYTHARTSLKLEGMKKNGG